MKNKKILTALIIIGIVLIVASFITREFNDKTIAALLFGIGFSVFGLSTSRMLTVISDSKNPEQAEIKSIEYNDERNVIIRHKAQAQAGKIQQFLLIAFAYYLMLLDASFIWIVGVVSIYLSFSLLSVFFYKHYQKKM